MDVLLNMTNTSYVDIAKKLHNKSVEFNKHLTNIKQLNDQVKERTEKLLTAVNDLMGTTSIATRITCNVCYTEARTHCLIPCGHAGLCESCAQRAHRRNRCHSCRAAITDVVRVYL